MQSKRSRGFTLIEVLVVVAIIALLTAILLPSMSAARHQSKRSVCGSQLQQIGVVWTMYAQSHKGFFPDLTSMSGAGYGNWTLVPLELRDMFERRSYGVKGGQVFYCPYYEPHDANSKRPADDWRNRRPDIWSKYQIEAFHISYVIYAGQPQAISDNEALRHTAKLLGVSRPDLAPPVKDSENRLAERPLLFDETPYYVPGGPYDSYDDFTGTLHMEGKSKPVGGNSVHGDGHVAWRRFESVHNGDPNHTPYLYKRGLMVRVKAGEDFTRFY